MSNELLRTRKEILALLGVSQTAMDSLTPADPVWHNAKVTRDICMWLLGYKNHGIEALVKIGLERLTPFIQTKLESAIAQDLAEQKEQSDISITE